MTSRNDRYYAVAEYDVSTKRTVLLKGSRVSTDIAYSKSFRGTKKIEKLRSLYVQDLILKEDIVFNSSSTAAVFVSGRSMNGLYIWRDANGNKLSRYYITD